MIDRAEIKVVGGHGGNGCMSLHREKFVPRGGPDGGDGGKGGNVYLVADPRESTLLRFRYEKRFQGENGRHGEGNRRRGPSGEDLWLKVPVGTLVKSGDTLLADLAEPGQQLMVARGGLGGWGNAHFATATYQTPRFAELGEPGEERTLLLDLKLLADVGVIGFPNVGKSTLLAACTAARPKIADYPFTTLEPVLGVAEVGDTSFVIADIPGLLEGAHRGVGLGDEFLRHIERTGLLVHVIDGTVADPRQAVATIDRELELFSPALREKPQVLAVNKVDLPEVSERRAEFAAALKGFERPVFFISAAGREGVRPLLERVAAQLRELRPAGPPAPVKVFRPLPREPRVKVRREGKAFIVEGRRAVQAVLMTDSSNPEAVRYLKTRLGRMGLIRALEEAGVQPGDQVRFGPAELVWE